MNIENTKIYGAKNLDVMTSQCPRETRKGICEYHVSFTDHWPIKLCETNRVHLNYIFFPVHWPIKQCVTNRVY